jgi:hypothetical protein
MIDGQNISDFGALAAQDTHALSSRPHRKRASRGSAGLAAALPSAMNRRLKVQTNVV